jgi:hypothetical protein
MLLEVIWLHVLTRQLGDYFGNRPHYGVSSFAGNFGGSDNGKWYYI